MKKTILHPVGMLVCGFTLGVLSRILDLYTENWGNVFSQLAIWILLGVLISIYSPSKGAAMANILPFCLGMLLTYYGAAILTDGIYSRICADEDFYRRAGCIMVGQGRNQRFRRHSQQQVRTLGRGGHAFRDIHRFS